MDDINTLIKSFMNTLINSPDYQMKAGPGRCGLNMPPALKSSKSHDGTETAQNLPPYRPRRSLLVDKYPACPKNWMRSEGKISSYFVPVIEGCGMWLDFNATLQSTPYHVAIVVSVQGVNAVTGLPCKDPQLEQYIEKCPKHDTKFGPERFCKECNFKWPKQNYIPSPSTPPGTLWIDGFRAADGIIRQYLLTADKTKGVANSIIGEQRVFAIGVSFFLSKNPRPVEKVIERDYYSKSFDGTSGSKGIGGQSLNAIENYCYNVDEPVATASAGEPVWTSKISARATKGGSIKGDLISSQSSVRRLCSSGEPVRYSQNINAVTVEKMEVGAGARVRQYIYDDPNDLSFWQTTPEGILVINYCSEIEAEKILEGGTVDVEGSPEGFLQKVEKGN